jgi:uncharacterized protein
VTQNWGGPNTGPQWNGQQAWNRPQNAWGNSVYPTPPPPPPAPPQGFPPPTGAPSGYPPPPAAPTGFPPIGGYVQPGTFPPPKRKNPLLAILAGAVFIVIVAFFLITLSNYLNDGGGGGGHQVTNVPAPDFNPPELPAPDTYDQAETWLTDNAIYDESVPVPTDCTVPYLNTKTATPEELEAHLNELTKCLWGVWIDPMTAAGFELPRPPVTVYSSSVTTACGDAESGNAFYCAADQHIYYATDLYKVMPRQLQTQPFVSEVVMAHEFGHAIQARTGILISEKALEQKVTNATAKELSRRTEVQADCMAGLFTNAVSNASSLSGDNVDNLKMLIYNIGDDILTGDPNYEGDHGSGKNRQAWFVKGLGTAQIGVCNSYTAASKTVR